MTDTEINDYHEPTREELAALNDVTPFTHGKTEPMLLIDLSGSMVEGATAGSDRPRKIDVVLEVLPTIVEALEDEDSEAADKEAAGEAEEEGGGVYTIGFSDIPHSPEDLLDFGDLNTENIETKKREILAAVGGGTHIVPGWNALAGHYDEEFGDRPIQEQPRLAALVITDGAASDSEAFGNLLAKQGNKTYVGVAIIGHGKAHDATVKQYTQVAREHGDHIRVLTFDSVTNPLIIARSLLSLIGK